MVYQLVWFLVTLNDPWSAQLWLSVKQVDSDKLPSAFCPWRTLTSSEVSEWRSRWSRPCSPAELMLFVFDSIHVSLHDDWEQYRTTTKLLVQTYIACVWAARCERVCVSKSTCPMHTYPYTVQMLQNKHASTHQVLPAAGVVDIGS